MSDWRKDPLWRDNPAVRPYLHCPVRSWMAAALCLIGELGDKPKAGKATHTGEILRLAKEVMTAKEIAAQVVVSDAYVREACKRYGVKLLTEKEKAALVSANHKGGRGK